MSWYADVQVLTFRPGPTAREARPHGVDSNEGRVEEGSGAPREVGGGAGLVRGAGRGGGTILSLAKAYGGLALCLPLCELHRMKSELLAGRTRSIYPGCPTGIYEGCDAPRTTTAPV